MKKALLSGMRPSGRLHLGHWEGVLKNWVRLQKDYNCYFLIADLHALTTDYKETKEIKENSIQMLIDWLVFGIDPKKSTIFLQSDVAEHTYLHLLLSMFTPLSWLERCPTYKEQKKELKEKELSTYGFLGYPILQAADILLYKAEVVPVGEDQLAHLEITREIARRFNYLYGKTFPEPSALLTPSSRLPGTDGRKMSKSYQNCIFLSDPPKIIENKVKNMFTDPLRIYYKDKGHPKTCPVFALQKIYNSERIEEIEKDCQKSKIGCTDCKKELGASLIRTLLSFQEKRRELEKDKAKLIEILEEGKERARRSAQATLRKVKTAMNL